jgi:hypothetical protein
LIQNGRTEWWKVECHSNLDGAETGERELSGEWVVGRNVWKRLKSERLRDLSSPNAGGSSGDERRMSWSRRSSGVASNAKSWDVSLSSGATTDQEGPRNGNASSVRTAAASNVMGGTGTRTASVDIADLQRRRRKHSEKVVYYVHGGK